MYGIEAPKLCAKNPHFQNEYAPLDEVLRVIKPFLAANEYDLSQTCQVADGHVMFVTQVINKDGTVVRQAAFPFDPGKSGPQAVGSAITYARRYGLLLVFNLLGEKDDDGERGEGRGGKSKPARKKTTKKTEAPDDEFGF